MNAGPGIIEIAITAHHVSVSMTGLNGEGGVEVELTPEECHKLIVDLIMASVMLEKVCEECKK